MINGSEVNLTVSSQIETDCCLKTAYHCNTEHLAEQLTLDYTATELTINITYHIAQ